MRYFAIIIACFVVFLGVNSCSVKEKGQQISQISSQDSGYIEKTRETQVKVFVNPEEIPQGKSPASLLREKAEQKGMEKIMNQWIRSGYLFKCSGQTVYDTDKSALLVHTGEFEPEQDKMTNVFSQTFSLKVSFIPVKQLAGKIVKLKGGRTLGGQSEHVTIHLFEVKPDNNGAYFLVAQKENLNNKDYFKVLGSGKVYHTIDQIGQGEFLETYQEITQDDYIFMLQAEIRPLKEKVSGEGKVPRQESPESELEEVIVEPKKELESDKKIEEKQDIQIQGKGT